MTFGERLTCLRKENGYPTRKDFAKFLGIPETTLRNYEKDEREPGHKFLINISKLFNVSIDYLMGLKEDKERTGNYQLSKSQYEMLEKYTNLDDYGRETIDMILKRESERLSQIKRLESRPISIVEYSSSNNSPERIIQYFQKVSAGSGELIYEDISEQITIPDIPKYKRVAYAVKVSGNSMEPKYHDGDMLLIEPACIVDIGEIGIFNVDNKAYVKKRGETELISLNEDYQNIPLTNESRCMGLVIDTL